MSNPLTERKERKRNIYLVTAVVEESEKLNEETFGREGR